MKMMKIGEVEIAIWAANVEVLREVSRHWEVSMEIVWVVKLEKLNGNYREFYFLSN
jgi:hypothetical protein